MSTTAPEIESPDTRLDAATPDQEDPFRYGWRHLRQVTPEGYEIVEQVPLSLIDVLHPEEDDFIMQNDDHVRFCNYLYNVFCRQLAHDSTAVVLHDVRIAWDVPDLRPHGPDIAVMFGVREQRNWGTFNVAKEGTRPAVIIEVTSPNTRYLDLYEKVEQYDLAGVPLYIVLDTHTRGGKIPRRIWAYQQTPNGYAPLQLDAQGRVWVEPVKVWVGFRENRVACYDEAGNLIGDYVNIAARAVAEEAARRAAEARASAAEARAVAEEEARRTAEARLQAVEAELRRLRGEG